MRTAWTTSARIVTSTISVTSQMTTKTATCCTAGRNRKSLKTRTKLVSPTNDPFAVNERYSA